MTPKQAERLKNKITKIKHALADDKKRWGGFYDDSRGLRYLQPELYIKLDDYTGALSYFNWFQKNFPDDSCFAMFLFEWTLTLHKTKRIKQAETKALETFFSNTYLFDKFLQKEPIHHFKNQNSNWEQSSLDEYFHYSRDEERFSEFTEWLEQFLSGEKFYRFANRFIEIQKQLETEPIGPIRNRLIEDQSSLPDKFENE